MMDIHTHGNEWIVPEPRSSKHRDDCCFTHHLDQPTTLVKSAYAGRWGVTRNAKLGRLISFELNALSYIKGKPHTAS